MCVIPVVGSFNVAVPSSPTVTSLPGFFALTLSSTCFFSSWVKCALSFTGTFSSGFTGVKSWFTKSVPGIVCVIPVVGSFNVAVPSSPTVTSLPGFFALTLSSTCFFSSWVKCALSFTGTFSSGFTGVKSWLTDVKSFGCAVTVVGSDGWLSPFVAVAVTWLLSLTPSAGINNIPVLESTVTPAGLSDELHVPFLALTTVTVLFCSFSSV